MNDQNAIPVPQDNDSKEVRWALETASSLWASDAREALRWLRRAAESASDGGDDLRSVQLASAAADLRNKASIAGSMPPAASGPPPASIAAATNERFDAQGSETLPETPAAVAGAASKAEADTPVEGSVKAGSNGAMDALAPMTTMGTTQTPLMIGGAATGSRQNSNGAPQPVAAPPSPAPSETPTATATPAARANSNPPPANPELADSGLADSGLADSGLADSGLANSGLANSGLADPELDASELDASELNASELNASELNASELDASELDVGGAALGVAEAATMSLQGASAVAIGSDAARSEPALTDNNSRGAEVPSSADAVPLQPVLTPAPAPVAVVSGDPVLRVEQPVGAGGAPPTPLQAPRRPPIAARRVEPAPANGARLLEHRAVRVAISRAPAGNGLYQLHPLAQGESIPKDWTTALLVGLDDAEQLFSERGQ